MLGPSQHSFDLATHDYEARVAHAARIHQIQRERLEHRPVMTHLHRSMTARRLAAAGLTGLVLAAALTLGVGAAAAAPTPAGGGGPALIR